MLISNKLHSFRNFVVQSTSGRAGAVVFFPLWFALKFVSLWCNRHHKRDCGTQRVVVICFKICIFVVQSTSQTLYYQRQCQLWFALKFVSLWCNRHPTDNGYYTAKVVICFKICIFVVQSTSSRQYKKYDNRLWFALKFVSLWCNRHPPTVYNLPWCVVICFKICIFVVQSTSTEDTDSEMSALWFALKFVSLWCNRHLNLFTCTLYVCCDLL